MNETKKMKSGSNKVEVTRLGEISPFGQNFKALGEKFF
jgi:hypothetical protein